MVIPLGPPVSLNVPLTRRVTGHRSSVARVRLILGNLYSRSSNEGWVRENGTTAGTGHRVLDRKIFVKMMTGP